MPYKDKAKTVEHSRKYRETYDRKSAVPRGSKPSKWSGRERERARELSMLTRHGVSRPQYDSMLRNQGGACAICMSDKPGRRKSPGLHVDHDHATGAIRGLLCHGCNLGIGLLKDNVLLMENAIKYLESGPALEAVKPTSNRKGIPWPIQL